MIEAHPEVSEVLCAAGLPTERVLIAWLVEVAGDRRPVVSHGVRSNAKSSVPPTCGCHVSRGGRQTAAGGGGVLVRQSPSVVRPLQENERQCSQFHLLNIKGTTILLNEVL